MNSILGSSRSKSDCYASPTQFLKGTALRMVETRAQCDNEFVREMPEERLLGTRRKRLGKQMHAG